MSRRNFSAYPCRALHPLPQAQGFSGAYDYKKALAVEERSTRYEGLGNVYRAMGRQAEAIVSYEKALQLDPNLATVRISLVAACRKAGREAEAQEHLAIAWTHIAKENEYNRACFEAICGNVDEALVLLEEALRIRPSRLDWVRRDPDFEELRDDPRFRALVGEGTER